MTEAGRGIRLARPNRAYNIGFPRCGLWNLAVWPIDPSDTGIQGDQEKIWQNNGTRA